MDDQTQDSAHERQPDGAEQDAPQDSPAGNGSTAPAAPEQEGFATAHAAEQNRLLRALPAEEYAHLLLQLTPVRLGFKQVLIEPDERIHDVYFPREGVSSILATEQEGDPIEVGTIGPDGFIGIPVLLGAESMPYRVFMQIEGHGWRISADAFRQLVDERPVVRHFMLRYAQYYTNQVSQSVACNRLHTLDERCARWLLMTHDRVEGDRFELTHEFLSLMLGVRRAGVSVAMGTLQAAGIIVYARGRITILDRARLEEASCGCYHITRTQLDRLLGGASAA
jgi:CRP-like cAMP-binding protein